MKYNKIKNYAIALAEVLSKTGIDEKKVTDNFVKLLVKTGQEKKSKEILNMAEDLLLKKQGKSKVTFEVARRLTAENKASLKKFIKEGDIAKEKINHGLIAGVKIIINNEKQFDNSMLSKLNNIL
jgi:F0F1-type ATP synthase delta subunit